MTNPKRDDLIENLTARLVTAERTNAALAERLTWYQAAVPDLEPAPATVTPLRRIK